MLILCKYKGKEIAFAYKLFSLIENTEVYNKWWLIQYILIKVCYVLNSSLSTGNTAVNKRDLYPLPLWSLHCKLNKKLSRDFLGKRYSYDFRVPLTDNYKEQSIFSQWKDSDGYCLNQIIHTVLCICLSSWQAFFL